MSFCVLHARFNMTMDVYRQVKRQTESGEVVRTWEIQDSGIKCIARGISGGGIRVVGSTERWGDIHEDVEYVKIQTAYNLSKRDRVANIRDVKGNLAWEDGGIGMEFDVIGSSPVIDPFGNLIEYDALVLKADIP